MYAFGGIYFPLSIVLAMQHKFWYVLLSILFNTMYSVKFPLRLTFWSMGYLEVYCFISKCLEISYYWLQIDSVMIRKYVLHISIFYTFVEVYFMVWHVVYLSIYFVGAWKCVFYYH